ncbi:CoA ester lyase [Variovorax sp. J22R133]|uniref:HpcH/HpaI aldolase/citrate lyase family protein n=1 Tax=Variovorax brevis TaxID=3053503 RepID=UPI002578CA59|nr:CoA ester lyase [Variovorax sp. J22R133]MDM0116250.1 CoA ester lyase [Variovorax sp. J22R133]
MQAPRSFLFVPGDSDRKMAKASSSAAQALVLDLEDAVAADRLEGARATVRDYLASHPDRKRQQVWVRINPIDSDKIIKDLAAIVSGAPDGVLLPKCRSWKDIARLDNYLTALEGREAVGAGSIRILPVATETASSVFELGNYRNSSTRLMGLTWGAEDLSTAVGASTNKDDDGKYSFTYDLARSLCLLGAKAAGVHAVDTIFANFRDPKSLQAEVRRARQDGFTSKFAIHPDQLEIINTGFQPDASEIAHAQAVVAAFSAAGSTGAAQVDGKMVDKPHLTQALQILEAAGLGVSA